MNRIFIGADPRQLASLTVCMTSIIQNAKSPVAITPLVLETLPMARRGLTPFTFSRFLVPHLCDYKDVAIFMDADILVRGDITELFDTARASKDAAVLVNKAQPEFEWASVILFNNEHPSNAKLTPAFIDETSVPLHRIKWCPDEEVHGFPAEWNVCVGYETVPPDAKLVHFTQGVPYWFETRDQPYGDEWRQVLIDAGSMDISWFGLMGSSVHADAVIKRLMASGKIAGLPNYLRKLQDMGYRLG